MYKSYSVLMSVYYKEQPKYLEQSIISMLKQTLPTNDFVIICDGPLTPGLDEVIYKFEKLFPELFHIICLKQNLGLGNALKIGIKNCKNELVARMDSDDISVPERCQMQLDIFNQMPDVSIVSGFVSEFEGDVANATTIKILPETDRMIKKYSKVRSPFNHASVMYKKGAVARAGSYRDFYHLEDYDLWVRMLAAGNIGYNIQRILLNVRAGNEMFSRRGNLRYLISVSRFRWHLKQIHYISWGEFLVSWTGHAVVCILPNHMRILIYKTLLRKKV